MGLEYSNKKTAAKELRAMFDALDELSEGEGPSPPDSRVGSSQGDKTAVGLGLIIQRELARFRDEQQGELQLLRLSIERDNKARSQWPDVTLRRERDQQEYDNLKEILRALFRVDVSAGAVQVQQIVDSVIARAELRLTAVMVADEDGWTTAVALTSDLRTPYLSAKYSAQVENARKRVKTEQAPLFRGGRGRSSRNRRSSSPSPDRDSSPKRSPTRKPVSCYVCGVAGHYANRCPDSKSKGARAKPKPSEK